MLHWQGISQNSHADQTIHLWTWSLDLGDKVRFMLLGEKQANSDTYPDQFSVFGPYNQSTHKPTSACFVHCHFSVSGAYVLMWIGQVAL